MWVAVLHTYLDDGVGSYFCRGSKEKKWCIMHLTQFKLYFYNPVFNHQNKH